MIKDSRQDECPPPEHSVGVIPPPVSSIQPKEVILSYIITVYFHVNQITRTIKVW